MPIEIRKRTALFKKLRKIAHAALGESLDQLPGHFGASWDFGHTSLTIVDENYEAFTDLIDSILANDDWRNRVSNTYLREKLIDILWELRNENESQAQELFRATLDQLDKLRTEQTTYIPISGLVLYIPQLIVGPITFKTVEEQDPVFIDDDSEHGQLRNHRYRELLLNKVCGIYHSIGEPNKSSRAGH